MKTDIQGSPTLLSKSLLFLLDELGEECERLLNLRNQLHRNQLSMEQIEDILAELTASVSHIHIHTKGMDDLITQELQQLPDE